MRAENKIARRTTCVVVTPADGPAYLELKTEMRSVEEACKTIDLVRSLAEHVWGEVITLPTNDAGA